MPAALAHDDLLRRAEELDLPSRHHIDGADEPGGGASFAVVSPRDGRTLVEVADAHGAEVDLAVAAARRAFDRGPWPRMAPADRGRILLRVADLLEERRRELALTIT
ncbi:aldehyde dehydrogenase family protein, partial [Streptomyces scabiei]